ncbi:YoaK family protein [Nocardia sp. NPDC051981]|uniref:YoaK family protein n=1 Tax=Nocardia sp. NPDC051981 TaxID=3155417 RepID=UPI0034401CD4
MSDVQVAGMSMREHVTDAVRLIVPPAGHTHGPLPPLLLALTVVTGLVDAFSYLQLGHVLVANMTGNVVFSGFALGGAPGFVWWALLLAIVAFLIGALAGGRLRARVGAHRGRHLNAAAWAEFVLVIAAFMIALGASRPYHDWSLALLIVFLGLGLGLQNATARALAVPDLTTTVLTLTLTGIAADSAPAGGSGSRIGRRVVPIAAMFLGAAIGAALVVHQAAPAALGVAAGLLALVVVATHLSKRSIESWTR